MKQVYLDNAATTPMAASVIQTMTDQMTNTLVMPQAPTHSVGPPVKF